MSNSVSVVADSIRLTGGRRPVACRPALGSPVAHPVRAMRPARVARVAACVVADRAVPVAASWLLRLKVLAVSALALTGAGVAALNFASWSQVDPAIDVVAGDPGWAHVTGK